MTATDALAPATYAGPDRLDRILGLGALAMLAAVFTALIRGRAHWGEVPWFVWLHLATIIPALALTPLMLWRRRGDSGHRALGYVWCAALFVTAVDSFAIRAIHPGHLSLIHVISAFVLYQIVAIILAARRHDHARHRGAVRGMVIGALLIAGVFTFPFGRMLGRWLAGG